MTTSRRVVTLPALLRRRLRSRGVARRFLADRSGAVELLEFALVGPFFIAILGATIETALAFWSTQILETALGDTSRLLYTGQFQQANPSATGSAALTKLRDAFCKVDGQARATTFTCANVKLDVRVITQFTGNSTNSPVNTVTKDWTTGFGTNYAAAKPGDIVIVQAAVKFPIFFTLLNPNQATFGDGSRLLQAAVAFRAEPF